MKLYLTEVNDADISKLQSAFESLAILGHVSAVNCISGKVSSVKHLVTLLLTSSILYK